MDLARNLDAQIIELSKNLLYMGEQYKTAVQALAELQQMNESLKKKVEELENVQKTNQDS